jgi:hypothetical protein
MAATDIQYGGLDPVLYTPDFTFLRYVLGKKTALYEKGLQSASAAYNNIKKELTDPVNAERREQFLKEAQGQLQQVASSDLSLQQNVNFANSIFDPIATNKAFLVDSYYTEKNKKELAQMDAWQNSDDPTVRKKFNSEIQAWLKRDLETIRNGKGDVGNYKAQGRSAFAYLDPQDILDEAVKAKGFKYEVDDVGQPYIITTKGGPSGALNYNIFANEVLSSNPLYQQQAAILGESRKESVIEMYKTDKDLAPTWANKSNEEIYKHYSENAYVTHKDEEQKYIKEKKRISDKETAEFDAYTNANVDKLTKGQADVAAGVQSEEATMYTNHLTKMQQINGLNDEIKTLNKDYDNNYGDPKNKENYVNSFIKNPTAFFANQQMKRDIATFTSIKKSSIVRKITPDRAYVDVLVAKTNATRLANDIKDDIHDNTLGDATLAEKEREFDIKMDLEEKKLNLQGKKTRLNADGTKTIVPLDEPDVKFIDANITQVGMFNTLLKLKDNIAVKSAEALSTMTGVNGAIGVLEYMQLDGTKVGKVRDMFTRYFNQDGQQKKALALTKEEQTILTELGEKCLAFSKNNPNSDYATVQARIEKDGIKVSDIPEMIGHAMKGFNVKTMPEFDAMKAMDQYNGALQSLTEMGDALAYGKKAAITAHRDELQKAGMLIKGADGLDDLINEKEIEKQIPTKQIGEVWDPKTYTWKKTPDIDEQTKKEIAQEFIAGSLKAYITKEDKSRGNETTGKTDLILSDGRTFTFYGDNVFKTNPVEYNKIIKKINSDTPIPEFNQRVGTVAASPFYKINGQPRIDILDTLGSLTSTNSNIIVDKDGTGEFEQADEEQQKLVRDVIASKDAIAQVLLLTHSPTNKGGQAVEIKFETNLKSGQDKHPLAGMSFYFPITPTEMSRPIFQVFNKAGEISEYEKYKKKGEPYLLNTFEGSGIRAKMQPLQPGSNEGKIIIEQRKWDPVAKKQSDTWEVVGGKYANLPYSLNNNTFPEIKNLIYNDFIFPYISQNIGYTELAEKEAKAKAAQTGTTPPTPVTQVFTIKK